MKQSLLIVVVAAVFWLSTSPVAQAQWQCVYATYDDDVNGTGHNTPSVGVISEDMFVALVMTPNARNFMIPYASADSGLGRLNFVGYGSSATSGIYQFWSDGGFDQVAMKNAGKLVVTPDSLIYVANNDPAHNILVFKFTGDTVAAAAPFPRQETGSNSIFGLAVDANGHVYVCNDTSNGVTNDLKIYNPVGMWSGTTGAPLQTIDLPDGVYRGIAVSPNGDQLFVADTNRLILKYTGSPATGYTLDGSFSFQMAPGDTIAGSAIRPGPINLSYLGSNNILFAAVDAHGYTPSGTYGTYSFGRIYLLNPYTGALISTDSSMSIIDVAAWNYVTLDSSYTNRAGGTVPGNASGYASTYDVAFDENGNVYSQSYFGWTVEKWTYNGTLPVISGVERVSNTVPEAFRLEQNFPNPFNPATTIEFTVLNSGSVSLKVFDLLGREVTVLAQGHMVAGTYRATFEASNLPGGIYFYTLRTHDGSVTKKMTLVK
ncbi:MAG TPA: T9SS type A sorting domain-containing protein [Bacteroidota bacterium]